jgi:ribonuclease III
MSSPTAPSSEDLPTGAEAASPATLQPWDDPGWKLRVRAFADSLGFPPDQDELVVRALTHRGLAEVAPHGHNERLEFLGDSVLALIVSEYVYATFPEQDEGQLTKMKVRFVSEPSLAQASEALDLGSLLLFASADEAAGGRMRPSTLSDVFEAILAALYLSRGLESAREFVMRELIERVDPTELWDHKSRLQELFQEKHRVTPAYRTVVASGPAHERIFRSEVVVNDETVGEGTGRSKKAAEQAAAADALARLAAKKSKRRSSKKAAAEGQL